MYYCLYPFPCLEYESSDDILPRFVGVVLKRRHDNISGSTLNSRKNGQKLRVSTTVTIFIANRRGKSVTITPLPREERLQEAPDGMFTLVVNMLSQVTTRRLTGSDRHGRVKAASLLHTTRVERSKEGCQPLLPGCNSCIS